MDGEIPIPLHEPVTFWSFDLLEFVLPFHPGVRLLEIRSERGICPIWCLERNGVVFRLEGEAALLLHDTAETAPLVLTQDNLLDYLRFFCFFVHAAAGPFFIVDGLDHPVWDLSRLTAEERNYLENKLVRPRILSVSDEGTFSVRASVVYADMVYNATFDVFADGAVQMRDDEGIARELPVRLLKPDYRIDLKN